MRLDSGHVFTRLPSELLEFTHFPREGGRMACFPHAPFALGTWTFFLDLYLAVTCSVYLASEEQVLEFSGDGNVPYSSSCSVRQRAHVRASAYGGFRDGVAHFPRASLLCILREVRAWTSVVNVHVHTL